MGRGRFRRADGVRLDGGAPAPVAVKFIHLRTAEFAVGAIELVLIGEAGVRPAAPEPLSRQDLSTHPPQSQTLVVDPLRISLMPGHVTVDLSAATSGAPQVAAAPALSIELGAAGGARLSWYRLPFRRRAAGAQAGTWARWDFAARDLRSGTASIEFEVPAARADNAGGDGAAELRIVNHGRCGLALTKLNLKKIRQGLQKNLIIIGNCEAEMIHKGFHGDPALQKYFRSRYYDVNLGTHFHEEARRDLQNCNLLVVQDIGDWEDCPLRQWVPDRAEIIMFPCIRFASLWPFDGWNGPTDQHAIAQEAPNFTFSNLDGLLARLRKEIPDRDRRFEAYRSLDLAGIVNYARLHDFETRRMLALDAKYDCEIGHFILDRFQSEQLFYTTVHPNRRLFGLLMANIMRSLGISSDIPHLAAFDQMQVPVHPKVAEALGVRWATPERKYRFRQEELTWEQYVRRYIDHYG